MNIVDAAPAPPCPVLSSRSGRDAPAWSVGCRVPFGSQRAVTVLAQDDRVVPVAPPGQAAVLTATELTRPRSALTQACTEAAGAAGAAVADRP